MTNILTVTFPVKDGADAVALLKKGAVTKKEFIQFMRRAVVDVVAVESLNETMNASEMRSYMEFQEVKKIGLEL